MAIAYGIIIIEEELIVMEEKKDKVYKEFLGEPHMNKKELRSENEKFMSDETSKKEQDKILNQKIQRIEKMVYYISGEIGILFVFVLLHIFGIL